MGSSYGERGEDKAWDVVREVSDTELDKIFYVINVTLTQAGRGECLVREDAVTANEIQTYP